MAEEKFAVHTFRERLLKLELKQEIYNTERAELRQAVDELTIEIRQQFEGINGQPGITTRLDRLEQTEKGRSKWTWFLATTSIGSLCTVIVEHFLKH